MMSNQRVTRLRQLLEKHELEALLVTNAVNRRYLSGFTGSSGYVVITPNDAILFTDFRYREQAPQQAVGFEVIEHQADAVATIAATLQQRGIKQIGFEHHDLSYGSYRVYEEKLAIPMVPADQLVEQLRMVKDEQEIALIQEAATLVDR